MTREAFKEHICSQIDMMDDSELEEFASFIQDDSEDKNVAEELIGIKGEFKKLTKLVQSMEDKIERVERTHKEEEIREFISFDNFLKNSKDAIDSLPKASIFSISKTNKSIEALQSGFTTTQYDNILNTLGVKRCANIGDRFDANLHEVVEIVDDRDIEDETIVEVLEDGFIYSDKIINYAKVKVNRWTL